MSYTYTIENKNIEKSKTIKVKKQNSNDLISVTNEKNFNFLSQYKMMKNYGEDNVGIFICNTKKNVLIKGEKRFLTNEMYTMLNLISVTYPEYIIFPEIHNVYRHNNIEYIEMERFAGDATNLLFNYFAKTVFTEMCDNQVEFIMFHNFYLKLVTNKITKYEPHPEINFKKFNNILNCFCIRASKLLITIIQQIYRIKMLLMQLCLNYNDDKLDNYGYILSDFNSEHLGVQWKNNKIEDKYFFITLLDWSSGLTNQPFQLNDLLDSFNFCKFRKYGQKDILKVIDKILPNYDSDTNQLKLELDELRLYTTQWTLKYDQSIRSSKKIFDTIEANNDIIIDYEYSRLQFLEFVLSEKTNFYKMKSIDINKYYVFCLDEDENFIENEIDKINSHISVTINDTTINVKNVITNHILVGSIMIKKGQQMVSINQKFYQFREIFEVVYENLKHTVNKINKYGTLLEKNIKSFS